MTNARITQEVTRLLKEIRIKDADVKRLRYEVKLLQEQCPHAHREKWTNDDGDGPFAMERCKICGLQKDGGL